MLYRFSRLANDWKECGNPDKKCLLESWNSPQGRTTMTGTCV